jgi:4-hydroxy-tetrahydrodipicolinate reductase
MTRTSDSKGQIAIAGGAGRMGRALIEAAHTQGLAICGASEAPGSPFLGADLSRAVGGPAFGITFTSDCFEAARTADVWIDFTRPEATLSALKALEATPVKAVIIGTTGFSALEDKTIAAAATRFAIVKAGNFSLGIHMLMALTRLAAERLGEDWDIEILETHHRRKIDAPSGTALMLGEAAAAGRGEDLSALRAVPRNGREALRAAGSIGFAVRRSGGVIGEHEVSFASESEIISLSHTALDRSVFAHGAIRAARWAAGQPPGLYGLADVLSV